MGDRNQKNSNEHASQAKNTNQSGCSELAHSGASEGVLQTWVQDFVAPRTARPDVKAIKYLRKSRSHHHNNTDEEGSGTEGEGKEGRKKKGKKKRRERER